MASLLSYFPIRYSKSCYIDSDLLCGDTRKELAVSLHYKRYENQDSLKECAEKLGVDQSQVENLELSFSNTLDLKVMADMARIYGCKLRISLIEPDVAAWGDWSYD